MTVKYVIIRRLIYNNSIRASLQNTHAENGHTVNSELVNIGLGLMAIRSSWFEPQSVLLSCDYARGGAARGQLGVRSGGLLTRVNLVHPSVCPDRENTLRVTTQFLADRPECADGCEVSVSLASQTDKHPTGVVKSVFTSNGRTKISIFMSTPATSTGFIRFAYHNSTSLLPISYLLNAIKYVLKPGKTTRSRRLN